MSPFFQPLAFSSVNQSRPPAVPYAPSPTESARKSLFWGWWLVGGACVLAVVPFFGMLAWFIGPPLILAAFVLSIIAMSKGRTGGGVALLLFTLIVAPATIVLAPIISTFIGATVTSETSKPQSPDALRNLPGTPEAGN